MNGKKKNLGLNVGKKKSGLFFFFWLGHELGPISKQGPRGPWGPAGAGLGLGKKPGTLNEAGPSHGSCPVGRVRVWKNPARTRPVATPSLQAPPPTKTEVLTNLLLFLLNDELRNYQIVLHERNKYQNQAQLTTNLQLCDCNLPYSSLWN